MYYLNSKFSNVINVTIRGTQKGSDGKSLLKVITNDTAPNLTNEFVMKGRGTWQYCLIEFDRGLYKKIKLYGDDETLNLQLRLYYRAKNYYIFVFDLTILKDEENQPRVLQVFYRIKNEEIYAKKDVLLNRNTRLLYLKSQTETEQNTLEEISQDLRNSALSSFRRFETIFENVFDFNQQVNFLPFIF